MCTAFLWLCGFYSLWCIRRQSDFDFVPFIVQSDYYTMRMAIASINITQWQRYKCIKRIKTHTHTETIAITIWRGFCDAFSCAHILIEFWEARTPRQQRIWRFFFFILFSSDCVFRRFWEMCFYCSPLGSPLCRRAFLRITTNTNDFTSSVCKLFRRRQQQRPFIIAEGKKKNEKIHSIK